MKKKTDLKHEQKQKSNVRDTVYIVGSLGLEITSAN